MRLSSTCLIASAAGAVLLLSTGTSFAIPAFSRANKVECSTCHTVFPELSEYGEAFLKNGYVYFGKGKKVKAGKGVEPSDSSEAKQSAESDIQGAGDPELLKKLKAGRLISTDTAPAPAVFGAMADGDRGAPVANSESRPEGIALAGIPEYLPISFSANLVATYNHDAVNEFDFSTRALKLNAGGNFKEKAGFFATYVVYTENAAGITNTGQTPTNLTGKNDIGELFLVWRHALDTPVNIKVGRFEPKLGLWKSNNKLSITNPYATYSYTVGSSPFMLDQAQDAVEANMIYANRLFMAGGLVNRKNQNTKEWYVHSSVKFGGADYLANEPEIDLDQEERILDFLTCTVGGYGYVGTNGDPNTVVGATPRQNDYYRAGLDIDLLYKLFRLKLSGVLGHDDNPDLTYALSPAKSYVAAIEGEYTFQKNLIGALRFEYVDDGVHVLRRIVPTLAYSPLENLKVVAEYKQEYGAAPASTGSVKIDNQIGTLGVTFSF